MRVIDGYVEERIRRPAPADSNVVAGSTPVVSFGDARSARVATLGLNPSRVEFLAADGTQLFGSNRRLATHESVGTGDLMNASKGVISQVADDCNTYFHPGRNPYRRWFDQLEPILHRCGASYYDGTACHLDLIQWATDPTWRSLPRQVRAKLLVADLPFLTHQMRSENLQLVLLNGKRVIREIAKSSECVLNEAEPIEINGVRKALMFVGTFCGRARLIG